MKIAFVSDSIYPYYKGGKEKRLFEISTRLAAAGHDVHIYCMKWWEEPEKDRQENGLQLHAISKLYPLYKGETRSIKEGVLFGVACLKMIFVKADIIDVDSMPFFPVYSTWLACLLRGKKLFGTWHEALSRQDWIDYMGKLGIIAWFIEHISIKLPYAISSASVHTKNLLEKFHSRTKRVLLVTPGIDVNFLKRLSASKTQYDVMCVCRLVKDKNVDVLIRSIAILNDAGQNTSCLIVGKGPESTRLQSLIEELGLEENITLISMVPESNDLYAYMKSAKVFVLPSVREGFCIVALEALGCGTPVITTNSPANAAKDLVTDGVDGSVVPLIEADFAHAIKTWVYERPRPDTSAKVSQYDWTTIIEKQIEVYQS